MKKWLVTALVALGVTGCSSTHYLSDTDPKLRLIDLVPKSIQKSPFTDNLDIQVQRRYDIFICQLHYKYYT